MKTTDQQSTFTTRRPARRRNRRGMLLSFELVIMLPVMLLIVLAIVEFSLLLMSAQGISMAAHRATREAALPGADYASVEDAVKDALRGYVWKDEAEVVAYVNHTRDVGGSSAVKNAITGDEIMVVVTVPANKAAPDILAFIGLSTSHSEVRTSFVTRRE